MNTAANALPDIRRPGVGTVMSSEWTLRTPERQRRTAETLVDVWSAGGWPDGLQTYSFHLGTDGSTILHYSQWRDDRAYQEFFRNGRGPRVDRIDAAVPGIERHDLAFYRLRRTFAGDAGRPEIIVTEFIEAAGEDDARRRIDALSATRERTRPAGLITAGLHLSSDGRRILDYSEWSGEEAFDAHLGIPDGTRRIKRFRPYRSLAR
ncbi:hypothetical protein [Actinomadura sp. 21ATH]|uniref:hypothetical protein n=1 Tax=Actinomadura sp. 21ATH TaxID=1735444 RepID=UPI0035C139C5